MAHGRERRRNDLVNWSFLSENPFRFRPVHGGTTPDVMERLFPRALSAPGLYMLPPPAYIMAATASSVSIAVNLPGVK